MKKSEWALLIFLIIFAIVSLVNTYNIVHRAEVLKENHEAMIYKVNELNQRCDTLNLKLEEKQSEIIEITPLMQWVYDNKEVFEYGK